MWLSQSPSTFHKTQCAQFHCIAYDYSHADWDDLHDDVRGVPWEDIFELSTQLSEATIAKFYFDFYYYFILVVL